VKLQPSRTATVQYSHFGRIAASRLHSMTPIASALLGLVVGAVLGTLTVWLVVRRAARKVRGQIVNRHHLGEILKPMRAAVVVVTEADYVIAASDFAKHLGMARGSSLAPTEVVNLLTDARRAHRQTECELRLSGAAGEPIQLAVRAVPLSNGAAVIIGEDRSEDLRFSETRRDFVANISHELKTPIGAIGLLAEAADSAADDPEAVHVFLAKLGKEIRRLNELVSQIIALSRLQAADPMLAAHEVLVAQVLESAVARCRAIADAGGISVTVQTEPGLQITGDAEELETAVTNLVQNAIAYSEPGARVAVTSNTDTDGMAAIRVSDNGIGISAEHQARIFERFFRVDAGRSRASGGTGLGLSIVKHVAVAHGGEVTVWSRVGQGSTFTLRLPLSKEEGLE
jgi:two-component system, OmpR family, sensor histidine kinase SenX3